MGPKINRTDSLATLSPLKSYLSSKQSLHSKSTNELETRLQEIDNKIVTWKKIATKEHIDISEEKSALRCLMSKPQVGSDENIRLFSMMLIEERKGRICSRIVKKVRKNFVREPNEDDLKNLGKELFDLTNKIVLPWKEAALEEGVDIAEEIEALDAADRSSFEKLAEKSQNPKHVLEVVQRRLKTLRIQCGMQIMFKTYTKRINDFAEKAISKDWFDEERRQTIVGIANDALSMLPRHANLQAMEKESKELFELFKKNIELFDNNPKEYAELADREYLRREIIQYSEHMINLCKKKNNLYLARQIYSAGQIGLQCLQNGMKPSELKEMVNKAMELFNEQLCGSSTAGGCGFIINDPGSHSYDKDPNV